MIIFIKFKKNLTILFLSVFVITKPSFAVEPLPNNLTAFSDNYGIYLLKKNINVTTLKLLSHFNTQKTPRFCGVASSVMILNSINNLAKPLDEDHAPYRYFTQDNFFNNDVKQILDIEEVKKAGISLRKLGKALKTFNIKVQVYFANEVNLNTFKKILKTSLKEEKFIIVNFLRSKLHQKGGGHFSPIAAYNERTDQFLILDVAQYRYPAFWVKTADLWRSINTLSGNSFRGFIIIENTLASSSQRVVARTSVATPG